MARGCLTSSALAQAALRGLVGRVGLHQVPRALQGLCRQQPLCSFSLPARKETRPRAVGTAARRLAAQDSAEAPTPTSRYAQLPFSAAAPVPNVTPKLVLGPVSSEGFELGGRVRTPPLSLGTKGV